MRFMGGGTPRVLGQSIVRNSRGRLGHHGVVLHRAAEPRGGRSAWASWNYPAGICYMWTMTKLLQKAIQQVEQLPEDEQDAAAGALIDYLAHMRGLRLTDEQLAEVRRRRANRNRASVPLAEVRERLQAAREMKIALDPEAIDDLIGIYRWIAQDSPAAERAVSASVAPPPGQPVGMELHIPEQLLRHADAFHEQADVELVRHAHAAVHLHRLLAGELRRLAGLGLGDRGDRAGTVEILVHGLQRLEHGRARHLQVDIDLGRPVRQRLELADGAAELPALLEIRDGAVERFGSRADELGRK